MESAQTQTPWASCDPLEYVEEELTGPFIFPCETRVDDWFFVPNFDFEQWELYVRLTNGTKTQ